MVMPDPLDMQSPVASSLSAEDEPAVEPAAVADSAAPATEPLGSPFLTDAKVEKRPLNADPLAASNTEPLVSIDELIKTDIEEPAAAQQAVEEKGDEPPIEPQVPELASDLVAIEATGKATESETELTPQTPSSAQPSANSSVSSEPAGPTSIAQQYKPLESTGDQTHAAIYNAEQYPEPLAHPAKKKSGWLWVVFILALLALGSGGAVALYMSGIIP